MYKVIENNSTSEYESEFDQGLGLKKIVLIAIGIIGTGVFTFIDFFADIPFIGFIFASLYLSLSVNWIKK